MLPTGSHEQFDALENMNGLTDVDGNRYPSLREINAAKDILHCLNGCPHIVSDGSGGVSMEWRDKPWQVRIRVLSDGTVSAMVFKDGNACEPVAGGWVDFGIVQVKRFGERLVASYPNNEWHSFPDEYPEWLEWKTTDNYTTAEIDAAYAAHVAAKPVLEWDDSLYLLKRAKHRDGEFTVMRRGDDMAWEAEYHTVSSRFNLLRWPTEEVAKAACERHAKGE